MADVGVNRYVFSPVHEPNIAHVLRGATRNLAAEGRAVGLRRACRCSQNDIEERRARQMGPRADFNIALGLAVFAYGASSEARRWPSHDLPQVRRHPHHGRHPV